jgi:hypothetical protein
MAQEAAMHDHMTPIYSRRLADELKRLWNEPTTAKCLRLSRDPQANHQTAPLDAWEDEGGTTAPREFPEAD